MKKTAALFLILLLVLSLAACSAPAEPAAPVESEPQSEAPAAPAKPIAQLTVTSETIHSDGKLPTVCCWKSANPAGENVSPQLSWDAVDGAGCYCVYMLDVSANCWLHWRVRETQLTSFEQGATPEDSDYKGPYPPSDTHEYKIFVYALKAAPDAFSSVFDGANTDLDKTLDAALDLSGGENGNLLGKGSISCFVTSGEAVE